MTTMTDTSHAGLLDAAGPRGWVTDGGLETDLIFHRGVDLPEFAAFPLLDDDAGRALLTDYYEAYAAIAAAAGAGLLLESPTWRASTEWGARVGYGPAELRRVNAQSVAFLDTIRQRWSDRVGAIRVVGSVGPRGDGYRPGATTSPEEAAAYHRPQVEALAGADLVTAYTLTGVDEATGIALAAAGAGVPVAISFTVETDGRLPDGTPLGDAIEAVDAACPPAHFLVNCAHPSHITPGLAPEPGPGHPWRDRIAGLRVNSSTRTHAELDEATELDDGDPRVLAEESAALRDLLPGVRIVGGCCGTDSRHVAAMWGVA